MKQIPKAGAFGRQKFVRALREETGNLIGAFVIASMSLTAFRNYAKHHNNGTLFAGWTLSVFFAWAFFFIARNIVRAARENEKV